jgi:hypothetical protein
VIVEDINTSVRKIHKITESIDLETRASLVDAFAPFKGVKELREDVCEEIKGNLIRAERVKSKDV